VVSSRETGDSQRSLHTSISVARRGVPEASDPTSRLCADTRAVKPEDPSRGVPAVIVVAAHR